MALFKKDQKVKYQISDFMYLIQNELIDVLKLKNAIQQKLDIEKVINKLIALNPSFSEQQIQGLYTTTSNMINKIKISESGIEKHLSFLKEYIDAVISNKDVKVLEVNYHAEQAKLDNDLKSTKETSILNNLLVEQTKLKNKYEKQLQSIKLYLMEQQVSLKSNPNELRNIRKAIERAELAKQQADQQIGVLNTAIYAKETEMNILNQSKEMDVVQTISQVDINRLTQLKAETTAKVDQLMKSADYLDELNKLNADSMSKTNAYEDNEFLNEWLGNESSESNAVKETNDSKVSFEDFLKSIQ
jgi:hypothetical protein